MAWNEKSNMAICVALPPPRKTSSWKK